MLLVHDNVLSCSSFPCRGALALHWHHPLLEPHVTALTEASGVFWSVEGFHANPSLHFHVPCRALLAGMGVLRPTSCTT